MRRREFIAGLGGAATWPLAGCSQQDGRVRALQLQILRLQAEGAAEKISQFIREIENQMGWTTQLTWSASNSEQRKFDGSRLLRQVPAITVFRQLDPSGKEQLRTSRLLDLGDDHPDYSHDPKFTEAVAKHVYWARSTSDGNPSPI
jgi:two-component system, NtrC family, sensor kinase